MIKPGCETVQIARETAQSARRHSPTLASLRMVEETIKHNNGKLTRTKLWKTLPKNQTYRQIIDYFVSQHQVFIKSHKIFWISYPDTLERLLKQSVPA